MAKRYVYEHIFRGKHLYLSCRTIDAMIKRTEQVLAALHLAKKAKVRVGGDIEADYTTFYMNDRKKADALEAASGGFFDFIDFSDMVDGTAVVY